MPRGIPGSGKPRGPTQAALLAGVIAQLEEANKRIDSVDDSIIVVGTEIETNVTPLLRQISGFSSRLLEFFTSNDLQQAEDRRELLDTLRSLRGSGQGGNPSPGNPPPGPGSGAPEGGIGGWTKALLLGLGIPAILGLVGAGFASGLAQELTNQVKMIGRLIGRTKIGEKIAEKWNKLIGFFREESAIGKFLKSIGQFFGRLRGASTTLLNPLRSAIEFIKNLGRGPGRSLMGDFRDIARFAMNSVKQLIRPFRALGGLIGRLGIATMFDNVLGFFVKIPNLFKPFFKFGKALGKILGKLVVPVTVILALWDTVEGIIDGYKTDGIVGAFRGGAIGLINSLVGWIIDIPKDILSWISAEMGFEDFSKWLDGWTFKSVFTDFFDWMVSTWGEMLHLVMNPEEGKEWLKEAADSIWYLIKDVWKSITDWLETQVDNAAASVLKSVDFANDFVKGILRASLPVWDNSAFGGALAPNNVAVAALKAAGVYDYVGMSPDTGKIFGQTSQSTSALQKAGSIATKVGNTTTINNYGGTTNNSSSSSSAIHATPSFGRGKSFGDTRSFGFGE